MAEFQCQTCGAQFPTQEALMQHSGSTHQMAQTHQHFACQACGVEFDTSAELQAHVKSSHRM